MTQPQSVPTPSRIWSTIDLDTEGRQFGYFRLTVSSHERDAAAIPIPVASFRSGEGPRVLILGGVHGDEFEGQFMAMKLLRSLDIENVRGQIIVMPAANAPAAFAGRRTSPLDDGDLNRSWPGDPNGSPTQQIAHFIESILMPRIDYMLDFHSGGHAAKVLPSAHVYHDDDPAKMERLIRMLEVFAMPVSCILKGLSDHGRKSIGTCDRLGVLRFASELSGGGGITVDTLRRAEAGLVRLLHFIGAIHEPMAHEPPGPTRFVRRLPQRQYVYAPASGLFEPLVELGEQVEAGQAAGAIHFPEQPWSAPAIARFEDSGEVYCVQTRAPVHNGDLLFMLCVPWSADA